MSGQLFKSNDLTEQKVRDCFAPAFDAMDLGKDQFAEGAFECFKLGEVLLALRRSPVVGVVSDEIFVQSFFAIHDFFTRPGTFEFYLDIFRKIWGEDVEVEFVVPSPGKLQINIDALDSVPADFLSRSIVDNEYEFDEVIDDESDNIAFQTSQGIKTQREADALMRELHPAGIWVETTLVIS